MYSGILFSKPKVISQLEQAEDFQMMGSGMLRGVYLGKWQRDQNLNLAFLTCLGTIRGLCSEDTGQGPPLMCQYMEIAGKVMSPFFVSGHLVHQVRRER